MQHRQRDYVAETEAAAIRRRTAMDSHPLGAAQMHSPLTPGGVSSPFGADPLSSTFHDPLLTPTASISASPLSRGDPFHSGENTPSSSTKPKGAGPRRADPAAR